MPALDLRDEKGRPAPAPAGKTLYAFFKTSCPTCALAWPFLARIQRVGEGAGLSVLAVSQDDPETTKTFYGTLGVSIPTLYDREPWSASQALGLTHVPTFLLVGPEQRIEDSAVGFQKNKMEQFAGAAFPKAGRPAAALFAPGESVPAIKPG